MQYDVFVDLLKDGAMLNASCIVPPTDHAYQRQTMPLPTSFYVRLSGFCFVLGGCMELFMLKTGFYDVCVFASALQCNVCC